MFDRIKPLLAAAAIMLSLHASARAQECQNQLVIDAYLLGCSAAGDVCGGVCGAAKTTCEVACDVAFGTCDAGCAGCDLLCDTCCATTCFPSTCSECRSGCTNCREGCDSARSSCDSACQLDCDGCILDCEAGCPACEPFRKIGESCVPLVDSCADGLVCWPAAFSDQSGFQCFPGDGFDLSSDSVCRSMYSPGLHQGAIDGGIATSYGAGAAASAAAGGSVESGTVYGPDGCYGCYVTTCIGAETNVEINAFAALGQYRAFDDFPGEALVEVGSAGVGVVSLVLGQVFSAESGAVVGAVEALALGPSLVPVTLGLYFCDTSLDTVGCLDDNGNLVDVVNNPPVARCIDVSTCELGTDGLAEVSIDDGSFDPDGDDVTLLQNPLGPYEPGALTVTLTVTDPSGRSDSCTAEVMVSESCTGPGLCGAGAGCTPEAAVLGIILLMLCGTRRPGARRPRTSAPNTHARRSHH